MLSDKHKIEKEQNAQLRNQVAQLLQLEQEQKMQIQQRDSTIQTLQVGPPSTFLICPSKCWKNEKFFCPDVDVHYSPFFPGLL